MPALDRRSLYRWVRKDLLLQHHVAAIAFEMTVRQTHWAQCGLFVAIHAAAFAVLHSSIPAVVGAPRPGWWEWLALAFTAIGFVIWIWLSARLVQLSLPGNQVSPASPSSLEDWANEVESRAAPSGMATHESRAIREELALLESISLTLESARVENRRRAEKLKAYRSKLPLALGLVGAAYILNLTLRSL